MRPPPFFPLLFIRLRPTICRFALRVFTGSIPCEAVLRIATFTFKKDIFRKCNGNESHGNGDDVTSLAICRSRFCGCDMGDCVRRTCVSTRTTSRPSVDCARMVDHTRMRWSGYHVGDTQKKG